MTRLVSHSWRARLAAFALLLALLALAPAALAQDEAPAAAPGLDPGAHVTYEQRVPVNIVFVGYERGDLSVSDMQAVLPGGYAPIVRYPPFYGLAGRDMGLQFNFKYNVVWAGDGFENDFFGYLAGAGEPGPMTLFQSEYNAQAGTLDVTDPVLYVDAPATEWWLMSNAGRLGVDTGKGYTIFFINWYSRPDFQFHVYTRTDVTDPDTGYNFGELRPSRKMIAWGGTHGRTWFYDLSAGPESWAGNYDVTNEDVDGDGVADYRIPPIWEYAAGGYRDPAQLGEDLGLVARLVAINLLFTPSPLYDPLASSPGVDGAKINHLEIMEADDDRHLEGTDFYDIDYAQDALASFQPYYDWQSYVDLNKPPDSAARRALRIFSSRALVGGCWEDYGTPFAQLFCHFNANYGRYVPAYGPNDYVATTFAYYTTNYKLGVMSGLLGFADDNWIDGTPSYVFAFETPTYAELGYGFSTTIVHEVGHHIGMSHPHDGYDSEWNIDYGPGGDFYFAWSGDEVDSVMSYHALSNGFGHFDQANMGRYLFAGYLNWANALLAEVKAHPDAASVRSHINAANDEAMMAQRAFNRWEYTDAATHARHAYEEVARAAWALGISTDVATPLRAVAPAGDAPIKGDPIRFPDN